MFKVTVRGPDGSEKHYPLGPDQGLIVGRDETCDICLPSKRVSRRHARFYTNAAQLHVEDLGSQNGVFVGGARIAGDAEIRPGPPIEIGEFNIRIRREDLSSANTGYTGNLQGYGTMEGKTLQLPATITTASIVGRDDSANIVVPDESVSRHHAELRFGGPTGYFVKDLESSNGTYVNGSRLPAHTERPLRPNDRINFGETSWVVESASLGETPATAKSRLRAFLLLGGFFLTMTIVVVSLIMHLPVRTHHDKGPETQEAPALDRCNQAIADQKWTDAQKACGEAYEEEPFVERRKLMRMAQRELHYKEIFDDAMHKDSQGSDRDAVERFFDIDAKSSYFPQSRLMVQQLTAGLMRSDGNTCRDAARKHAPDKALVPCRAYLRYQCHNVVDADALKILRTAESALKEKAGEPWVCPTELDVWLKNGAGIDHPREATCLPRYEDKDICDAMMSYVAKKADDAGRKLAKVKGKSADLARKLGQSVSAVGGKYKEGQTVFASGNFPDAEKAYRAALETDEQLMQPGVESDYAKDIKDTLAAHYQKLGDDKKGKEQYDDAFKAYMAGSQYRPKLKNNLDDLEKIAAGWLSEKQSCDHLRRILDFTRPESNEHKKTETRCPAP